MGEMIKEQEMSSGKITLEQRKASLRYHVQEYRKRRVIIDTDAACEADDPFAIAQALMSKMLEVKGTFCGRGKHGAEL